MHPALLALFKHRTRLAVVFAIVLIGGVLLTGSPGAANVPTEQTAQIPDQPIAAQVSSASKPQGWGDDGIVEIGVEWINDFPGTDGDRSHWDESCDGLYYAILDEGWTSRFHYTDWNAWEDDWKLSSRGGWEDSYADNVDLAMVCTHGSGSYDNFWNENLSSVYFGATHDDQHLVPGDTYRAYGDKDLEWVIFDSCSVFSENGPAPYYNRGYWSTAMDGLHLMMGFLNTMYVSAPGDGYYMGIFLPGIKLWGFYILPPMNFTQAWFTSTDYNQPTVTCARVLAETNDNFNDHLWGKGYVSSDPSVNGYYAYWDHCSAGLDKEDSTTAVIPEALALPVVQVQQRQVNEDYILNRISPAFDISGTIYSDDLFFLMMDNSGGMTRTLMVDKISGSFDYKNLSELWVTPVVTPTLPIPRVAHSLAEDYFKMGGEGLPGVWERFGGWMANYEGIREMQQLMPGTSQYSEVEVANMPVDVMVTYEKAIDVPVTTAEGVTLAALPVVGPGSGLRVYFGDGSEIIGMHGGGRDTIVLPAKVDVLPFEDAWMLFLGDNRISLPEFPYDANDFNVITYTLGYYEMPFLIEQTELIPVWITTADVYSNTTLLAPGVQINIPAAAQYLPPVAKINSPMDGATFEQGELVTLLGEAQYGLAPYTFEWVSAESGLLGYGETLPVALWPYGRNGTAPQEITLTVTDANGQTGSASIEVYINPRIYMPVVIK